MILMVWSKTVVTPLLTHWSYHSLVPNHLCKLYKLAWYIDMVYPCEVVLFMIVMYRNAYFANVSCDYSWLGYFVIYIIA